MNTKDDKDRDALYYVAHYADPKAIKILLKAGTNVNNRSAEGDTSLLSAVNMDRQHYEKERRCHVETVNMLIKAGAHVNAHNKKGQTALFCVAARSYVKCMKPLLEAEADVNVTDNDGVTALIEALRSRYYKCANILLKAGADVNAKGNAGVTALHLWSCGHRYVKCVKGLLRAGSYINQKHPHANNALGRILKEKYLNMMLKYDAIMILYAAGETLEGVCVDDIPKILKFEDENLQLKHICREAIRKHLLELDLHQHLFGRIPKLGLPCTMNKYLLYNQSLDDDHNDDDNDDDDTSSDNDDGDSDDDDSDDGRQKCR